MALFVAELKKLTSRSFGFWLVIAMLILKLAYLGLEDTKTNSFILENKAEYLSIVNRYTGKIYQSVSNQIESENAQVLRASDELRQLRIDYNDGKLRRILSATCRCWKSSSIIRSYSCIFIVNT